jgi:hypothetical protein
MLFARERAVVILDHVYDLPIIAHEDARVLVTDREEGAAE